MSKTMWPRGPWNVQFDGEDNEQLSIVSSEPWEDGDALPIADLYHGGYDFSDRGFKQINTAHLIAAAPELYEALRDFFENPDFVCTVGGNPTRVEAMMARARAALAKARGEQ